ncbi:hypothetical protein F5880DRAFT_665355 [Lentinula raphanica]|nr:hypothetical protein F5880DRAFT_665355 [Lentinula raphanica]
MYIPRWMTLIGLLAIMVNNAQGLPRGITPQDQATMKRDKAVAETNALERAEWEMQRQPIQEERLRPETTGQAETRPLAQQQRQQQQTQGTLEVEQSNTRTSPTGNQG